MEFNYKKAFSRNLGLVSPIEQEILAKATVAIAGLGAVGGAHLLTLARMGIQRFCIADFDSYELVNFNRQLGASLKTIGQSKAEVMKQMVLEINPDAQVSVFPAGLTRENVGDFFYGVDVALDGLDFFATDARDIFYKEARDANIPVVAAGPLGISAALLVFMPNHMSWHDYFALDMAKSELEKYILFALGTAPKGLHFKYIDKNFVDLESQRGPSLSPAIQLCAGVACTEVLKILLGRGTIYPAPFYQQFDAYKCKYVRGKLPFGNRGPIQRLKFHLIKRMLVR